MNTQSGAVRRFLPLKSIKNCGILPLQGHPAQADKRLLIVVDMQKDAVDGTLGTPQAQAIVERAAKKINTFDGEIIATLDTHDERYLHTAEGKKCPIAHCIWCTEGWTLDDRIASALDGKPHTFLQKSTFGAAQLPALAKKLAGGKTPRFELIGLRTDSGVIANALLLKTAFPEASITVDASCCAGVTPETHAAALKTMQMCQIDVQGM